MKNKQEVEFTRYFSETMARMADGGLLLASGEAGGKCNAMTIGWVMIGSIWQRPICAVLVRPSRYTFDKMEAMGDFTVNVPGPELAKAVEFCGMASGRDHDKFEELKLTPAKAQKVRAPIIQECLVHYECRTIHKNDLAPATLPDQIINHFYSGGDIHRVYYGEILGTYADADAHLLHNIL